MVRRHVRVVVALRRRHHVQCVRLHRGVLRDHRPLVVVRVVPVHRHTPNPLRDRIHITLRVSTQRPATAQSVGLELLRHILRLKTPLAIRIRPQRLTPRWRRRVRRGRRRLSVFAIFFPWRLHRSLLSRLRSLLGELSELLAPLRLRSFYGFIVIIVVLRRWIRLRLEFALAWDVVGLWHSNVSPFIFAVVGLLTRHSWGLDSICCFDEGLVRSRWYVSGRRRFGEFALWWSGRPSLVSAWCESTCLRWWLVIVLIGCVGYVA